MNSPWVFKSDEGKGDGASIVLQFNVTDFSIFEEEILNVSLLDVHGKIPHIDAAVGHGGWSSGAGDRRGHLRALKSRLEFSVNCGRGWVLVVDILVPVQNLVHPP